MENEHSYTMADIEKFISDYKQVCGLQPKSWMIGIPLIGRKMYQNATLENQKRVFFEEAYNKAINSSIEEQREFITKMAPILDDFYGYQSKDSQELEEEKGMKR